MAAPNATNHRKSMTQKWDELYQKLATMTADQEKVVTDDKWLVVFRRLWGYQITPQMAQLFQLPIIKRHINARGEDGNVLTDLLTWQQLSANGAYLADCLVEAGAKISDTVAKTAIALANDESLLWLHKQGIDIGQNNLQKYLDEYLRINQLFERTPDLEVVGILRAKVNKLQLETTVPKKQETTKQGQEQKKTRGAEKSLKQGKI